MSDADEEKQSKHVEIVIIGAGMAGLSAAKHLMKNGRSDFLILEARNRIGGRIISIDVGSQKVRQSRCPRGILPPRVIVELCNQTVVRILDLLLLPIYPSFQVELGANWIHGVLGNPMFEMAVAHGLVSIVNIPKPHKIVAATEDGKQVPFAILQEIYEAYVCFLRRCEEYFLCQFIPPPDIHSVGEHINLEMEMYLDGVEDTREKHLKQLIFNCLLKRETCITGCDTMNDIDLLELGSYTELQGGNIVLPTGYSSILKPLADDIPDNAIVKSCAVQKIHWKWRMPLVGDDGGGLPTVPEDEYESDDSDRTVTEAPTKTEPRGSFKVKVVCENNNVYYADHVICTVPLGVLKDRADTMFHPKLPDFKQESIDHLLFGTVDKIFLEYDRPFLNADISEVMFLWEGSGEAAEDETNDVEKNWYKKIYSFSKVTDTLLLGWISGRAAEYMETISHEEVAEKCTEILRQFLKDPCVPKPKRCIWWVFVESD